jgi:hypothetical protein
VGSLEIAAATAAVETGAAEDGNMEHKAIDAVTGADVSDVTFEIGAGMASLYHGTIVEDASDDEDVQSELAGQRSDGYEVESGGKSDCWDEKDECCQCNENIAHSIDFGCGKWAIDATEESDTWEFQAGHIRDGSDAHLADGMPRRVPVTVKTINGPREWYIDTAADSIWFSMEEFVQVGGAQFVRNSDGAESADGSPLAAIGRGVVTFSLWGRLFRKMPVRIMANLPSGILCSISRQLSRCYHATCEKCSFVALLDMDGVSHFYVLEWSACLPDPAKSLVVEPDRNFSKILVFRRAFGAVFASTIA